MKKKILIADALSDRGLEILAKEPTLEVVNDPKISPEDLKKTIGEYEGLVVRSRTKVTAEVIAAAKKLKVVGRAGSGVDNIDVPAATQRGIVVMNTPGGNTVTTAEHTISLMTALARQIPRADAGVKGGKWERTLMGVELTGKTLGIVGTGNIGSVVADRARGLQMNVVAYDPFVTDDMARKKGFEKVELDELFARADFISIHTPLLESTKNLIDDAAIAKMKKGVRIVNCARGGLVNEADLAAALKSGRVAGAAVDVFEKEPPAPDNPLLGLPNFICTPHLGASTEEAQENVALAVAEQLVDYLVHGVIRNAVNFPSISPQQAQVLGPYIKLAEKMGSMAAQLCAACVQEVTVEYSGEVCDYETKPITLALAKGLLAPIEKEGVNYVNAIHVATSRGINIKESKTTESHDYTSMIKLTTSSGGGSRTIAGVIFGKKHARIVRLDDFFFELVPEGHVLLIENKDVPGVVGDVGAVLGKHKINIAGLSLSREDAGGTAISLIAVDSDVPDAVLAELQKVPNILSAKELVL